MIDPITTILASASDLIALEGWLKKRVRANRGPKRAMLLEIQVNYRVLRELYIKNGGDPSDVIGALKNDTFSRLAETDFSFNNIKRSKIGSSLTRGSKFLSHYSGQSTEELVLSIYEKIDLLKRYDELHRKGSRAVSGIRFDTRLHNLVKLVVLLARHIKGF